MTLSEYCVSSEELRFRVWSHLALIAFEFRIGWVEQLYNGHAVSASVRFPVGTRMSWKTGPVKAANYELYHV